MRPDKTPQKPRRLTVRVFRQFALSKDIASMIMKQAFVLFNKERRETQWATAIFAALGLAPAIVWHGDSTPWVSCWVLIAIWFNLTVLCATAFAREKENGTLETLRRTVRDWRLAAFGKFAYAIVSTLILTLFFLLCSLAVDCGSGWSFGTPLNFLRRSFLSESAKYFFQVLVEFNISQAFIWGIFWTGRVSRQTSAILLSTVCSLLTGFAIGGIERASYSTQIVVGYSPIYWSVWGAVSLLLLVFAPGKFRFGYKIAELSGSGAQTQNASELEKTWSNVRVSKRGNSFFALFLHELGNGALLFRSPASILFELSALLAIVVLFYPTKKTFLGFCFVAYFGCFLSGLFADLSPARSFVKERLNVKKSVYWLAGVFAALFMAAVLVVLAYLKSQFYTGSNDLVFSKPYEFFSSISGFSYFYKTIGIFAYLFVLEAVVGIWIATIGKSRLVKGGATILSTLLSAPILSQASLDYYDRWSEYVLPEVYVGLIALVAFLLFGIASYRLVSRKTAFKRAPLAIVVPLTVMIATVWYTVRAKIAREYEQPHFAITVVERAMFDPNVVPKTKKQFLAEREAAQQTAATVKASIYDGENQDLIKLQEDATEMLVQFELTKRRVAPVYAAAVAEEKFYNDLFDLKNNLPQNDTGVFKNIVQTLQEIPYLRPTAEQYADNLFVCAKCGKADDLSFKFESKKELESIRKFSPASYDVGAYAICQILPDALRLAWGEVSENDVSGTIRKAIHSYRYPLAQGSKIEGCNIAASHFLESGEYLAFENEQARRFLMLKFAFYLAPFSGFQTTIPPQFLKNAGLRELPMPLTDSARPPIFSRSQNASATKSVDKSRLKRLLDLDGTPMKTDTGRDCYYVDASQNRPSYYYDPNTRLESSQSGPLYHELYASDGSPLVSFSGGRYYCAPYHTLSPEGKPIVFLPAPCKETPPFVGPNDYVGGTYEATQLSQSPAFNYSSNLFESSHWLHSVPSKTRGIFAAWASPVEYFVDNPKQRDDVWIVQDWSKVIENRKNRNPDEAQLPDVRFVGADGKEILDETGRPKYFLRKGIFEDVCMIRQEGYFHIFHLPDDIAQAGDNIKIYRQVSVGKFQEETNRTRAMVKHGCVFLQNPGCAFVVQSRMKLYSPSSLPLGEEDGPAVVYISSSPY